MKMDELTDQVSFLLGLPANELVEDIQIEKAALIAFKELKRYMKTPVEKTVPYSTRISLVDVEIETNKILAVIPAYPRIGLTLNSLDCGNVFQVAAATNVYSGIGSTSSINIDPLMSEIALSQLRNTLTTDFQWNYDNANKVIYCSHREPRPAAVTVRYVPEYKDISEINNHTWENYLVRLTEAYMKLSLGRTRSKYKISGSNVELDGDILIQEANASLEALRQELEGKKNKVVIVN